METLAGKHAVVTGASCCQSPATTSRVRERPAAITTEGRPIIEASSTTTASKARQTSGSR